VWICCQIGAREHYAIPRALRQRNVLSTLVTDAWADSWLPWKLGGNSRAAERYHPDIPSDSVKSFDWQLLHFELSARRRLSGWALTMARNDWFQTRAIRVLRTLRDSSPRQSYTVFSYSYAAAEILEFARDSGWLTVLGQMDPGPCEEKIVMDLYERAGLATNANPAPPAYWDQWRSECRLADRIIVNSDWSRRGLLTEGVAVEKIEVVPLAYDPPFDAVNFQRKYPTSFDAGRPLRILFLGQGNIRKGLYEILGAVSRLEKLPVEFWVVGDVQIPIPPEYARHPCIKWFGSVPRGRAAHFYRNSDVFLFPTFSDGFGLTQLEAQAWSLPVIASRQCGDVVKTGINGYLLPEVSVDEIAGAIEGILASPASLNALSAGSRINEFRLDNVYSRLGRMAKEVNSCSSS
jgi:glycosyltransferase involved in cell wall biosynthesis